MEVLRTFLEPPLIYAIAAGLAVLLVAWLGLRRYVNRRYVELRRSEATDQLAFHLARIAESLESLAASNARFQQRVESALERFAVPRAEGGAEAPAERRPRITPYARELGAWSQKEPPQEADTEVRPQRD